jgi:hypothetical protein
MPRRTNNAMNSLNTSPGVGISDLFGGKAWQIMVKHPMWKGWKSQVSLYGFSRDQAWEEARKAIHYYEGATATKVMPLNYISVEVLQPISASPESPPVWRAGRACVFRRGWRSSIRWF